MAQERDAAAEAAANLDHEAGLARKLTSGQIAMIGLSGALGTGLFLGSSSMIAKAGPAIILSYALTGLLCLAVIFAMAEMTTKHPVHGGFAASSQAYGGPFLGYLSRWNVALTMIFAVGVETVAGAKYMNRWFPDIPMWIWVAAFSALIIVINLAAVGLYGASEYWFSILKVVVVIAFILLGLWLIVFGLPKHPATGAANLWIHGGFMPNGIGGVLGAAVAAIFSFGGAENVSVAAAESAHPERDVPRAARSMIFRLLIFYIGAIAVVVTVQPWTVSATSKGDVTSSPFVTVLGATGIPGIADFMNFVLIIAALSAGNGCLYAGTRMVHSLAVDHMAPGILAPTTKKGTPRGAVIFSCMGMVVAIILALTLPGKVFGYFFGVLIFGLLATWIYITWTHILYRRKRKAARLLDSPVKLPGGAITSGIALAVLVGVVCYLPFDPELNIAIWVGLPVTLVIAALYLVVPRAAKLRGREHNVLVEEIAARDKAEGRPGASWPSIDSDHRDGLAEAFAEPYPGLTKQSDDLP